MFYEFLRTTNEHCFWQNKQKETFIGCIGMPYAVSYIYIKNRSLISLEKPGNAVSVCCVTHLAVVLMLVQWKETYCFLHVLC